MLAPLLDELAFTYDGRVKFTKLDVDENPRTAQTFDIHSVPTLLLFRDGKPVDRLIGFVPRHQLEVRLDRAIQVAV